MRYKSRSIFFSADFRKERSLNLARTPEASEFAVPNESTIPLTDKEQIRKEEQFGFRLANLSTIINHSSFKNINEKVKDAFLDLFSYAQKIETMYVKMQSELSSSLKINSQLTKIQRAKEIMIKKLNEKNRILTTQLNELKNITQEPVVQSLKFNPINRDKANKSINKSNEDQRS